MKVNTQCAVLAARVPKSLIRQLDKRAKESGRSRSAEVLMRLKASLKGTAVIGEQDAPAERAPQVATARGATHGR